MKELPRPNQVKDAAELTSVWQDIRQKTLQLFDSLTEESFSAKPADGSWSAADIAEHLYLTQFSYARMLPVVLGGKFGIDLEERPADYDYEDIHNSSSKTQGLKNPEQVAPTGTWDRKKSRESLDKAMETMLKKLEGKTVAQLRTRGLEHPMGGLVNMLEWMWILVLHENAHLETLKQKTGK